MTVSPPRCGVSFSTTTSTALFILEESSTVWPRATASRMICAMVKDLPVPGGPITSVSGRRSAWRRTRVCAAVSSAPARIGRLGALSGRDAGAGVPGLARAMSSKIAASGVDISPRPAIICSSVSTPRASVGRRTSAIAEAQSSCTGLSARSGRAAPPRSGAPGTPAGRRCADRGSARRRRRRTRG